MDRHVKTLKDQKHMIAALRGRLSELGFLTASISLTDDHGAHDRDRAAEAEAEAEAEADERFGERSNGHGHGGRRSRLLPSSAAGAVPGPGSVKGGACRKCARARQTIKTLEEELKSLDRKNPGDIQQLYQNLEIPKLQSLEIHRQKMLYICPL